MRFLVDAQLPPRLADWLRGKGHDAEHVTDALGQTASDVKILRYAIERGARLVTKDSDFIGLAERTDDAPTILWIRLGNAINRVLIAELESAWPRLEAELNSGKPVCEIPG